MALFETCDVAQRLSASHCLVSKGADAVTTLVRGVAMGVNGLHLHSLGARLFSRCRGICPVIRVSTIWIFSISQNLCGPLKLGQLLHLILLLLHRLRPCDVLQPLIRVRPPILLRLLYGTVIKQLHKRLLIHTFSLLQCIDD